MRSLRENAEVLVPMLDAERDREFYRLGLDFGYAENEALQFVDYLNGIIEVTSIRPVFDALRPRRPPGFGGTNRVPREP
jgi:hypothetical protein